MFDELVWLNEPAHWKDNGDELQMESENKTDFWRKTHYGFIRDSGHFFYTTVTGDFTCEVELQGTFETLYDQLGLMIRNDSAFWMKAGLEYTDNAVHISTVITNEFSDWSVVKPGSPINSLKLRLTRHGHTIRVQYQNPDETWELLRLAHLKMNESCDVGIMCCSPERHGFIAQFRQFAIKPPIGNELH